MPLVFDEFTLDRERRQLLRAGVPISLEPKAYELLSLLLARRPRALSKDQIHEVLWAGTFVSESTLAGLIADLRSVLGDNARRPRYIRTVHGFGYAFCGDARPDGEPAAEVRGSVLRTFSLSRAGAQRSFDRPFAALTAALGDRAGVAVHVSEVTAGSRPPLVLQNLASLVQPTQVLLSRAAFDLARDAADGEGHGLVWLAHGPYLFDGMREPIDVFEVGRPGESFLKPPPDTNGARRAVRPGDETTLGWRPAAGLRVPEREEWTFVDKLGEGGFGEVWLATHPSGERRVFKFCFDAARLRGLKREATLFRLLKDELGDRDNIAKVLDWNFDEAPYFLESEYTEGGSLVDWAKAAGGIGAISLGTRLLLIAQVAEALAAAHSVGVLHKDVKPQNVLITEDAEGKPKARLTDFGVGIVRDKSVLLGRDFTVTGFSESTDDANPRGSGTRLYAAPEVLEGKTPTTLADIYALGIMLYQIVVGDFERALAPGWERDVPDDLLRDDIGVCVEGRPERRLANALHLAERLQMVSQRRAAKDAPRRQWRNRRLWTAAGLLAAVGLGSTLFTLGQRVAERPVPQFRRITFQQGATGCARFTPDGRTIVYSRLWKGTRVFSVRTDSVESRSLGVDACVAATREGEMAVLLPGPEPGNILARMPLDGGAPRPVAEHVGAADWTPDGTFAIYRGPWPIRVEFPIGHVLYQVGAPAILEGIRISPGGDRVAFIEHPWGGTVEGLAPTSGHLVIMDRQGRKLVSSTWASIGGLAWTPDGDEVWFSATKDTHASALHAINLRGKQRLVAAMGQTIYLHDISRDGRVIVAQGRAVSEARGKIENDTEERDYSWLDGTRGVRFSRDGRSFIFSEALDGGGARRRAYLRRTDGALPVWLGDGTPLDISPDGKWVLCMTHGHPRELRLVPVGAGDARPVRRGIVTAAYKAWFLPDGKRLVLLGRGPGGRTRLFVQDLPDGEQRPFTAEGVVWADAVSADGRFVAARTAADDDYHRLYPVAGGNPQEIPGINPDDVPIRFSADGAALFVTPSWSEKPARVQVIRIDLGTHRRTPVFELTVPDVRADFRDLDVSPDGRSYLYTYSKIQSELYIIDGLR